MIALVFASHVYLVSVLTWLMSWYHWKPFLWLL